MPHGAVPSQPGRRPDAGEPLCVGRENELAQLAGLYRDARERERLALLEGPSGSGKSRILQELSRRIRLEGGVVLEGRCEHGHAFGPFATVVDRALSFLSDMSLKPTIDMADLGCFEGCHPLWHQHELSHADAPDQASREAREKRLRFFDAIRGLLRDVARLRPPLVILHDLERCDEGTLQLLDFLFEGAGPWTSGVSTEPLRALVVASVRDDMPSGDRLESLREHEATAIVEVGELDAEGVRQLLQSDATVRRILERTGGMPDAIELLLEAEPLRPKDLLVRRLETLSETARALVETLAVLGRPADLELLSALADIKLSRDDRELLEQTQLLDRSILDGRILLGFARARDRELTYGRLDEARRVALHTRCADRFEADGQGPAAHHALAAGDLARAVPLAMDEAHALAARHAQAEAAALLERVLTSAGDAEVPVELRRYLAELYRVAGDYRRALVHAEAVCSARPESPEAAHRVGRLLTLAGELGTAHRRLSGAHDLAKQHGDERTRTTVETLLAELEYQRANYDEAETWAEDAVAQAEELGELTVAIHARNTLGKVALARKDAATAAALFETNRESAEAARLGHQEAQALTNLGVARLRQQKLTEARQCFEASIAAASEVNDSRETAIATENLAVLAHLRHDYTDALEHYHRAVSLLKRLGNRPMLTRVGINLGELYLSMGDPSRARSLCDFAQHMGGANLPASFAAECMKLRGRIELAEGNLGLGRATLASAMETMNQLGANQAMELVIELARLELREGQVPEARQLLADAPATDAPRHAAQLALVAVDLERAAGGDVLQPARRACRLAEETDDEVIRLEAELRLARALAEADDAEGAHRAMESAEALEEALTARVPEESLASWVSRDCRQRLNEVAALVSSLTPRRQRVSTLPDAPTRTVRSPELMRRYPDIAGSSAATVRLLEVIDKVAPSDATVLVRGESGTGKELVAEALHRHSKRSDKPLVKVNCAALVETLLLSELFGHERGAFTGASARKKGRFELADGGTLFLDEIGDISPKTQVALLRVLQEREFERVGGTQPIHVDVRIVAATHRDLEKMVAEGTFREDLYYRLRGVAVDVPALRERTDDLQELSECLLRRIGEERGEAPKMVSADVLQKLTHHRWPGNVRELQNVLRSASLFCDGTMLRAEDFSAFSETFAAAEASEAQGESGDRGSILPPPPLEEAIYERIREGDNSLLEMKKVIERECIVRALSETDGNITRAAGLLGMKRPRLSQLVKQHGLSSCKRGKSKGARS